MDELTLYNVYEGTKTADGWAYQQLLKPPESVTYDTALFFWSAREDYWRRQGLLVDVIGARLPAFLVREKTGADRYLVCIVNEDDTP